MSLEDRLTEIAESFLEECGCCGCYHPIWFGGDCRQDKHRYSDPQELVDMWVDTLDKGKEGFQGQPY